VLYVLCIVQMRTIRCFYVSNVMISSELRFCAAAAFQTTHITNSQVPASSASSSRGRLSSTLAEDDKVRTVWDIDNDQKERKWFPIHPADALSGGRLYLD